MTNTKAYPSVNTPARDIDLEDASNNGGIILLDGNPQIDVVQAAGHRLEYAVTSGMTVRW